eukprot:2790757-Amphidinium_carterae.1
MSVIFAEPLCKRFTRYAAIEDWDIGDWNQEWHDDGALAGGAGPWCPQGFLLAFNGNMRCFASAMQTAYSSDESCDSSSRKPNVLHRVEEQTGRFRPFSIHVSSSS